MIYSVTSKDMTNDESSFLNNDTVESMNFNPSSANSILCGQNIFFLMENYKKAIHSMKTPVP